MRQNDTLRCRVANCDFIDAATIISAPKSQAGSNFIYCISYSRRGMHYTGEIGTSLRTKFGEHRRAVNGNDADQPVARHFNTSNHSVSDMEI